MIFVTNRSDSHKSSDTEISFAKLAYSASLVFEYQQDQVYDRIQKAAYDAVVDDARSREIASSLYEIVQSGEIDWRTLESFETAEALRMLFPMKAASAVEQCLRNIASVLLLIRIGSYGIDDLDHEYAGTIVGYAVLSFVLAPKELSDSGALSSLLRWFRDATTAHPRGAVFAGIAACLINHRVSEDEVDHAVSSFQRVAIKYGWNTSDDKLADLCGSSGGATAWNEVFRILQEQNAVRSTKLRDLLAWMTQ